MKLDVKKLTREELENLLVALTFDKTFDTYSKKQKCWCHTCPDDPYTANDVVNVKKIIRNGERIQKILAIFEENPTKEFRCKDLGAMIGREWEYQMITPIIKRLYAKGLLERIVKEEIATIPYYVWDDKLNMEVTLTKQAIVNVVYYKLAEGV